MTRIRRAEQKDIPWLLEQLRAFAAFFGSAVSLFPADTAVAKAILAPIVTTQPFFVAEDKDGMRVGFIAGYLQPHPYNPAIRVLTEAFWWVVPQQRGSSAGARLLDYFIGYGRTQADWVIMTLEHNSPVEDRVLTKRGFKRYSQDYLLEVSESPLAPPSTNARSIGDRPLQEV